VLSNPTTHLEPTSTSFQGAAAPGLREYALRFYDIQDFMGTDKRLTVHKLQALIHSQAMIHHTHAIDNLEGLRKVLETKGSTVRGFVLWPEGMASPVGYSIYFPMIDPKGSMLNQDGTHTGSRMMYAEDLYIDQSMLRHGLGKVMIRELARRALADGAQKLLWTTDSRNAAFKQFVGTIQANRSSMVSVAAGDLLNPDSQASKKLKSCGEATELIKSWRLKDLITRPMTAEDVQLPAALGMAQEVIRNNGDLSFKGFVTYRRNHPNRPLAITVGCRRLSTFTLLENIQLEPPVFAEDAHQEAIVTSIVDAARKYAKQEHLSNLIWHIEKDIPEMSDILQGKLGLPVDSMLGTKESEFILYTLENGALVAARDQTPDMVLRLPVDENIGGVSRRRPVPGNGYQNGHANQNGSGHGAPDLTGISLTQK
jgi:GNAT superfamily N-acetyltransferase